MHSNNINKQRRRRAAAQANRNDDAKKIAISYRALPYYVARCIHLEYYTQMEYVAAVINAYPEKEVCA